ncbi:MAG: response regulator [Alphaproteobacteria bacterium]|nr:response regulator [Alphaproteobacteria bacterium]
MTNAPEIDYAKLRVLIVEDEQYTRQMIRQLLFQVGVRSFIEAPDAKVALQEAVRTRPDVVFCDVHMGEFGGKVFLEGIRKIKLQGIDKTPVVMLTADATKDTVVFAKERQVAGYLVKPVSTQQLKQRIDAIIATDSELATRLKPTK